MGSPQMVGDDPRVQHLCDRQRQLLGVDGDPGCKGERLGLAVDQSQHCCLPHVDVHATTALNGVKQVLLAEVSSRPHHDLVAGAIH